MLEKEIGYAQLKGSYDEGPPMKRRRIEEENGMEENGVEENGVEENEVDGEVEENAKVEKSEKKPEKALKAFIKVCHKHLLLKSRELCDCCGIKYASIFWWIKHASGENPMENIVGALRDQEPDHD